MKMISYVVFTVLVSTAFFGGMSTMANAVVLGYAIFLSSFLWAWGDEREQKKKEKNDGTGNQE